jgi:hypothetical protein
MRCGRATAAVFLATLVAGAAAMPALAAPTTSSQPRVILVMTTGLQWRDITAAATPTMWKLAADGGVGNLNARSRVREAHEPASPLEGALSLSAGTWATPDYAALGSFDAAESIEGTDAATLFARNTAASMAGHEIGFLELTPIVRANAASPEAAVVGTLGQAVSDAGGTTSAIGNSDSGNALDGFKTLRPAAAAAMDKHGLVTFGDVSRDLLQPSAESPYGLRTDLAAFEREFSACEASASAHGGPALLVLDPGDEYRARRYATSVTAAATKLQHREAVLEADSVVAMALRHARPTDVVVVATQATADEVVGIQGFSPLLVSGGGLHGYLTSLSTHRTGLVADPDVTAFVLAALGVTRPLGVIGDQVLATAAPATAAARIRWLSARDKTAVSVLAMSNRVGPVFIGAFVALMAAAGAFLAWRGRIKARWRGASAVVLKAAALMMLAIPAASWAMFLVRTNVSSRAVVLLGAVACALVALAALAWRFLGGRVAIALLPLLTMALLVGDQLLGAPLSFANFIGYSPLQSARYYGIGNEAAALLLGSSLIGIALLLDGWRDASWVEWVRRFGIPALGALVVVTCAAPMFGANVGFAVWGAIGFFVLWMRANDWRITWRHAVVALVVIVLLVGAFAAVDLLGHGEKTHLARSLSNADHGGIAQLGIIVARKALSNRRILTSSAWPLMLIAALGFLVFARWRTERILVRVTAENPALGAAIVAALSAGVFGFFTEDTGVLVPTFIFVPVTLGVVWLVVSAAADAATGSPGTGDSVPGTTS